MFEFDFPVSPQCCNHRVGPDLTKGQRESNQHVKRVSDGFVILCQFKEDFL